MRIRLSNRRKFAGGLFFCALGVAIGLGASPHLKALASPTVQAYFPTVLAALLVCLGLAATADALDLDDAAGLRGWPAGIVAFSLATACVLLLAIATQSATLALVTLAMTVVGLAAGNALRWPQITLASITVTIFLGGVFSYDLALSFVPLAL